MFPTGRDSATFRDKGTTGQPKNLAKEDDGQGQPKSGTGYTTKGDRAEKDVLTSVMQKNVPSAVLIYYCAWYIFLRDRC